MQDQVQLLRAKRNRANLGPFEARLWTQLSRSQLAGHKFRRQHVIGQAIVDFFCPAKGLIVEVDDDTHDLLRDQRRDRRHDALGFTTLRFSNEEVGSNLEGVLEHIRHVADALPSRWSRPHPYPSPEGEGNQASPLPFRGGASSGGVAKKFIPE